MNINVGNINAHDKNLVGEDGFDVRNIHTLKSQQGVVRIIAVYRCCFRLTMKRFMVLSIRMLNGLSGVPKPGPNIARPGRALEGLVPIRWSGKPGASWTAVASGARHRFGPGARCSKVRTRLVRAKAPSPLSLCRRSPQGAGENEHGGKLQELSTGHCFQDQRWV
jgi:hypothetical protein